MAYPLDLVYNRTSKLCKYIRTIFDLFNAEEYRRFEIRLGLTQSHQKWQHSIDSILFVFRCKCLFFTVTDIFSVEYDGISALP